MNKQKDRLVELLREASTESGKHFRETTKKVLAEKGKFNSATDIDRRNIYEVEADYLLANGVIVPPCKVGDFIYLIDKGVIFEGRVETITYYKDSFTLRGMWWNTDRKELFQFISPSTAWGKTTFATKEEAEQALVNYESSKNDTVRKEDENGKKQ